METASTTRARVEDMTSAEIEDLPHSHPTLWSDASTVCPEHCRDFEVNSSRAKPHVRWCEHILASLLDEGEYEQALQYLEELQPIVHTRFANKCGLSELFDRLLPGGFAVPPGKNVEAFRLLRSAYPFPDLTGRAATITRYLWRKALKSEDDKDPHRLHFGMLVAMAHEGYFFGERDVNRCIRRLIRDGESLSGMSCDELKDHLRENCRLGNATASGWRLKAVVSARPSEEAAAKFRIALLQVVPVLSPIAKHILKCYPWPEEDGDEAWWNAALASKGLTSSTKPCDPEQTWDLFVTCCVLRDHEQTLRSFFDRHPPRSGSGDHEAECTRTIELLVSLSSFRNDEAHSDVPLCRYRTEMAGLSELLRILSLRMPTETFGEKARRLSIMLEGFFERELFLEGETPKTDHSLELDSEQQAQLRLVMACNRFEVSLSPALQRTFARTSNPPTDMLDSDLLPRWCVWAHSLYSNGHRSPEIEKYFSPGHVWASDILLALVGRQDAVESLPKLDTTSLNQAKEIVAEARHNKPLTPTEVAECIGILALILEDFDLINESAKLYQLQDCSVQVPKGQLTAQRDSNPTFSETIFTGRRQVLETIARSLVAEGGGGCVLLTGNPGFGKSAIAAQVERHEALKANDLVVIGGHHCFRQNPLTTTAKGFLQGLCTSLRRSLSSSFEYFSESFASVSLGESFLDSSAIVSKLCGALNKEPESEAVRLIVIDGLDEATATGTTDGPDVPSLVAMLGLKLPPGFALLATSRPDASILEEFENNRWETVSLSGSAEALADISEYVQHLRETDPAYAAVVAEEDIEELAQRSEGNFLVTKQVLAEAKRAGTAVQLDHCVPETAAHHLRCFRERFGRNAEQYSDARSILELLASREGPLSRNHLCDIFRKAANFEGSLLPIGVEDRFCVAWRLLQPFLTESVGKGSSFSDGEDEHLSDEDDDESEGGACYDPEVNDVTPYHSSLLEWLVEESSHHPFRIKEERGHLMLARAALASNQPSANLPPDLSLMGGLYHCSLADSDARDGLIELARDHCEGRDTDMPECLNVFCTKESLELWLDLELSPRSRVGSEGLIHVACGQDADLVKRFLSANNDQEPPLWCSVTDSGVTPLNVAAWHGHVEVGRALLDAGAPCHEEGTGVQPLHIAVMSGSADFARLLIDRQAPLTVTPSGAAPLHLAAGSGQTEMVSLILAQGVDINDPDGRGDTALHYAARKGHVDVLTLLLEKGATDSISRSVTAMGHAAAGGLRDIVSLLLDHGGSPNPLAEEVPPLALAAGAGEFAVVEFLIECGADVNAGRPAPLQAAAFNGHTEMVKRLIELGADKLAVTGDKVALQRAAANGHLETVCAFLDLERSSERNYIFPMCVAGLHAACEGGQEVLVEFFLDQQGIDVNQINCNFETPAFSAVKNRANQDDTVSVLRILFDRGADFSLLDMYGRNLLHCAAFLNNLSALEYLLEEHRIPLEARDSYGFTALHHACGSLHPSAARLLLDAGADPKTVGRHGDDCPPGGGVSGANHLLPHDGMNLERHPFAHSPRGLPLHLAVWSSGSTEASELINLLIDYGSPIEELAKLRFTQQGSSSSRTALQLAAEEGSATNVTTLLDRGASCLNGDIPPLTYAACSGSMDAVVALCEAGAGDHLPSCKHAFLWAGSQRHVEIVRYLWMAPAIRQWIEGRETAKFNQRCESIGRAVQSLSTLMLTPLACCLRLARGRPWTIPRKLYHNGTLFYSQLVVAAQLWTSARSPTVDDFVSSTE